MSHGECICRRKCLFCNTTCEPYNNASTNQAAGTLQVRLTHSVQGCLAAVPEQRQNRGQKGLANVLLPKWKNGC